MATLVQPKTTDFPLGQPTNKVPEPAQPSERPGGWETLGIAVLCAAVCGFYAFLLWLAVNRPPQDGSAESGMFWFIGP